MAGVLAAALLVFTFPAERATAADEGSISGTVTLPVGVEPGAMEHIIVSAAPALGSGGYSMVSPDPGTGSYTLTGLSDGQYIVEFYAVALDGPAPNLVREFYQDTTNRSLATPVEVSNGSQVARIDAKLELGGRITGRVSLPSEAPAEWLKGVRVYASSDVVVSSGLATVDPVTGEYDMTGLPAGQYRVNFTSNAYLDGASQTLLPRPNLIDEFFENTIDPMQAKIVPISPGSTAAGIDASLEMGASVSGTVTLPAGFPRDALSAVTVSVQADGVTGGYGYAQVDTSTGTFTANGLLPGNYRVRFDIMDRAVNLISEYYADTYDYSSARLVPVAAGQMVAGIDASLEEGAVIEGTVSLPDGLSSSDLSGVRVTATSAGGTGSTFLSTDVTPDTGQYRLDRLPAGDYVVMFEGSPGWNPETGEQIPAANVVTQYHDGAATPSAATQISLSRGQTRTGVNASLAKGATIRGTASFPGPMPYPAYLSVVSADSGQMLANGASTDLATGSFTIERLAAGRYYVFASTTEALPNGEYRYGSQFLENGNGFGVTVAAGGETVVAMTGGANGAAISGSITATGFASNATPDTYLGDAVLYQKLDSGWVQVPDDARGSTQVNGTTPYTIPGLTAGTYTVGFEKSQTPYSAATSVVPEWWKRKNTLANADEITLGASETRSGIDGTVSAAGTTPASEFEDVSSTPGSPTYSAFATEISWMSTAGISTGYDVGDGKKEYRPFGTVTRDAMAAFLYRAAGSPAYEAPAVSPFTDVSPASPFYKEITWLAEEGISTGWTLPGGRSEFRPFANITRDAMAAFLYRFAESPPVHLPTSSPFTDVQTDNGFYREISWLAQQSISTGWDAGDGKKDFRPYNAITRDAMAAFLFRYSNLE